MKNMNAYVAVAAGMLLFSACEKEGETNQNPASEQGSMEVKMTDAPANFKALMISVATVEVYREGEGWVDMNANKQTFNVLELNNGKDILIASSNDVHAGLYTRMRMTFAPTVTLHTLASTGLLGNEAAGVYTLDWKSSNTIEIIINEQVDANGKAVLLVDFDVAKSVVKDANQYYMKPAVTYLKDRSTGVRGQIAGSTQAMVMLRDDVIASSTSVDAEGDFYIQGVQDGTYELVIDYLYQVGNDMHRFEKVIPGVVVANGQITQMGLIQLK